MRARTPPPAQAMQRVRSPVAGYPATGRPQDGAPPVVYAAAPSAQPLRSWDRAGSPPPRPQTPLGTSARPGGAAAPSYAQPSTTANDSFTGGWASTASLAS